MSDAAKKTSLLVENEPQIAPAKVFGSLDRGLFVRISVLSGMLVNLGYLILYSPWPRGWDAGTIAPIVGLAGYAGAFLALAAWRRLGFAAHLLVATMDFMFLSGLAAQDLRFFTLVLSPLVPSFTLLLLGYRSGIRWSICFLALGIALAALRSVRGVLAFDIAIFLGVLNISVFSAFYQKYIEDSELRIRAQIEEITRLSRTDPLTKLFNRRAFMQVLDKELARGERTTRRVAVMDIAAERQGLGNMGHASVLLFDVDDFKKVNDCHGHLAGDQVLRAIGELLLDGKLLRETDCAARFGGEEFIVLEPDTNAKGALLSAERIRKGVEALAFRDYEGRGFGVTISCGVSEALSREGSLEEIIGRADAALLAAKASGKNRCLER
jgi:diguanylate cyclase (GGDEF)-like protein